MKHTFALLKGVRTFAAAFLNWVFRAERVSCVNRSKEGLHLYVYEGVPSAEKPEVVKVSLRHSLNGVDVGYSKREMSRDEWTALRDRLTPTTA